MAKKDFFKMDDKKKLDFLDKTLKKDPKDKWALSQFKKLDKKYKQENFLKNEPTYCKFCGTKILKGTKYCKSCGNRTSKELSYCKYCGKEIAAGLNYCKFCGAKLVKGKKLWLRIAIPAAIIIASLWLVNSGYASYFINIFPFWPTNPKTVTLRCNYSGQNLTLNTTLYGNIENYYHWYNYSQRNDYIANEQYQKFVYVNPRDKSMKTLMNNIEQLALNKNANDLELATCFIQNIPYDNQKYNSMLTNKTTNSALTEQLPYETLYKNKGICTDKTYLGNAILDSFGYQTSIMTFKNHMALGIIVPKGYGSFHTEYSYMELTIPGFSPGLIPSNIDPNEGLPTATINNIKTLTKNDDPSKIDLNFDKTISGPTKIIPISSLGNKSYTRIVQVRNLYDEITGLLSSLVDKKANLENEVGNMNYWKNKQAQDYSAYLSTPSTTQTCYPVFHSYPYFYTSQNCYTSPNFLRNLRYNTYSNSYNNYSNVVDYYNRLVSEYNNTLNDINRKINLLKTYTYN